jgi:hypothetical protein
MHWQQKALVAVTAAVCLFVLANKEDVERYLKMRRM